MSDGDSGEGKRKRATRMRLSAEKRGLFLEVLGQTGNRRAAADAIGVDPRLMDQRREYDAAFDRQWEAALDQADRRLSGADGPTDCIGGGGMNVIRRGRNGRLMIVKAGPKRWTAAVEERFVAALATCGNMAAAARAVGFSESCVWQRRAKWPAFAQRLEDMLDEAEVSLELRLAFRANDAPGRADPAAARAEAHALPEAGDRFDPDLAMRFLKWRAEKKRTGTAPSRGGRPEKTWTTEETVDELQRRIAAFGRRDKAQRLAEGWSEDEDGNMIPPGWVRGPRPDGEGGGDAA